MGTTFWRQSTLEKKTRDGVESFETVRKQQDEDRRERRHESRIRRLKNDVPQGSILAPFLFNIYISDLPTTVSRKYAYADDLAIMHADGDWQTVEGVLSKDMATVGEYLQLQTWKLNLSTIKTVSAAFHLNNKEAKRELKGNYTMKFRAQIPRSNVGQVAHASPTPWVTSQEAVITRHALEATCWLRLDAGATTLRTATLALAWTLVHSSAECWAPVWCRSAHSRLTDSAVNDTLQIVTGCLRPTPANNLPTLAGIQPAELRRNGATLSLARRAMEPGHLLHSALTCPPTANARSLRSRHPFVPAA